MSSLQEKTVGRRSSTQAQLSADRKLDVVFEQCRAEIMGTIYFLYSSSESVSKSVYEKLKRRCSRNYANSRIGDLRSWVFRVLYTLAFESVGNVKPKRRKLSKNAELTSIVNDTSAVPDESLARARSVFLSDVFAELSFVERAVFLLRQNGNLSYVEISRTTGLSLEQVHSLMKKTVLRLAEASDLFSSSLHERRQDDFSFSNSGEVE